MTPEQLVNLYNESTRQEARVTLNFMHAMSIINAGEKGKTAIDELERAAFPYDPESDGVFGKEAISELKNVLGM